MAINDFFVWGAGGSKKTPEQIAREREIADTILARAGDTSPVGHWTQGAARVLDALGGVVRERRAIADERELQDYQGGKRAELARLLSGGAAPIATSSTLPMPEVAGEVAATSPAVVSGGHEAYRNAIASIESAGSGDYSAVGPTNKNLGRALGRYQIMEANIGPWSREALGREVTPDEFLANPALQDAIFDAKFGQYVQQYGPEGAAQAWFAGPGGVGKTERKDVLGTTVGEYGQRFTSALGPSAPESAIEAIAPSAAPVLEPPVNVGTLPVAGVPMQAEPVQVAGGGDRVPLGSSGINPAIIEALADPRVDEGTRRIAGLLLEQEQRRQQMAEEQRMQAQDPLRQIQLERAQIELNQLRQPQQQPLINAGNGNVYNPNTGEWITAPGGGQQFRPATPEEAQRFGAAAGQFGPDNKFYPLNPPQGTSLSVDPATGAVTFNQGAGVKPLTEAQSKDTLYATRATNALPLVDRYESELLSLGGNLAEGIPLNLGNYAQSEAYQVARDAGRDFLATILRKDTGAAITANEEQIYGKMFLPQPGDKPAAIQAKRQRRALAVEAIKSGMPATAIENMAKALETVPKSTDIEVQTDIPGVKIRRKN